MIFEDPINHVAAKQYGLHFLKAIFAPIQNSDTSWTVKLVPGKNQKVHVVCLNIRLHVRNTLSTIHHNDCSDIVGRSRQFSNGIDGAQNV